MISPKDAAKRNDEIYADQMEAAEKYIDSCLSKSFSTGRPVSIGTTGIPVKDYQLRKKLIARYERAGWKVKHTDDQREGSYYVFSAKDPHEISR